MQAINQNLLQIQAGHLTTLPPLSLYIHIPYCVRKCPYCDFNSHAIRHSLPEEQYIDALLRDIESELPNIWGRQIHTIFIGGGTPALFQSTSINRLLNGVRSLLPLQPDIEITLEANPGVAEQERFQGFKEAGVTRLSIGVQSFSDPHLQKLGRIHNSDEAYRAIELANSIFNFVNVDIMYALPEQTPEQALQDIQQAIASGVGHISAYQLTLEPNTAFAHHPPKHLPDDDLLADIENTVHECLSQSGFKRYEISAFARTHCCEHNQNYWQFGDYLGIGAGAHGKISYPTHIERTTKLRQPEAYLNTIHTTGQANSQRQNIDERDLPFEFMLNVLRLIDGIPADQFQARTGIPIWRIAPILKKARSQNLMTNHPAQLQATLYGIRFLNELLTLFLPDK